MFWELSPAHDSFPSNTDSMSREMLEVAGPPSLPMSLPKSPPPQLPGKSLRLFLGEPQLMPL